MRTNDVAGIHACDVTLYESKVQVTYNQEQMGLVTNLIRFNLGIDTDKKFI